jgi:hypothetical protein
VGLLTIKRRGAAAGQALTRPPGGPSSHFNGTDTNPVCRCRAQSKPRDGSPRIADNMAASRASARILHSLHTQPRSIGKPLLRWPQPNPSTARLPPRRPISSTPRRPKQAADDPGFTSIVDNPPELVRSGRKHGPGLIILGRYLTKQLRLLPCPSHLTRAHTN